MIFVFGLIQMYSALFLTKYVDFTLSPYYSIIVMTSAQAFSLCVISAKEFLLKAKNILPFLYLGALLYLSRVGLGSPEILVVLSMAAVLVFYQTQIIALIEQRHSDFKKAYIVELFGSLLGVVVWFFATSTLGFKGFANSHLVIFAVSIILDKKVEQKIKAVYLVLGLAVAFFLGEPQPVNNIRGRYDLLQTGFVEAFKWDTNGYVEIINYKGDVNKKFILFDGGTLRSISTKFNGDYHGLRELYTKSDAFGTWGLDVVLPAYALQGYLKKAMLISTVGGQEILAARAFGADEIHVVDINQSALDFAKINLDEHSGFLYDNSVKVSVLDGRKALEDSDEKFDLIQIYSASNATFLSGLGPGLRPSSLITAEALQLYIDHLNENGILHIAQRNYLRVRDTVSDALLKNKMNNALFAISKVQDSIDINNFYIKKSGWTRQEIDRLLTWLRQNNSVAWKILYHPYVGGDTEEGHLQAEMQYGKIREFKKVATDDWPFIDIWRNPLEIEIVYFVIAVFIFSASGLAFVSFRSRKKKINTSSGYFWLGILYGITQQILIVTLQKTLGRPDWGLVAGLSLCLLVSAGILFINEDQLKLSRLGFFMLFLFFAVTGFFQNNLIYLIALIEVIVLQSLIFTKNLYGESDKFRWIWWTNGLGFVLGACLFYVGFSIFGFQKLFTIVGVGYAVLSLLLIKKESAI